MAFSVSNIPMTLIPHSHVTVDSFSLHPTRPMELQSSEILALGLTAITSLIAAGGLYGIWDRRYRYPRVRSLVLAALKEGPMTGLELRRKLDIGTVLYVDLHRMRRENIIRAEPVDEKSPTRFRYSLSDDHVRIGTER